MFIRPMVLLLAGFGVLQAALSYVQINRIIDNKIRTGIVDGLTQRMIILSDRMDEMISGINVVSAASLRYAYSYLRDSSYFRRAQSKARIEEAVDSQALVRNCSLLLLDMSEKRFLVGTTYLRQSETLELLDALESAVDGSKYTVHQPVLWNGAYRMAISLTFEVGPARRQLPLMAIAISSAPIGDLFDVDLTQPEGGGKPSGRFYLVDGEGELLKHQEPMDPACVQIGSPVNSYGIALCYESPSEIYYQERNMTLMQMAWVSLLGIGVAIVLAGVSVRRIQRSIACVTDAIERIEPDMASDERASENTGIIEYDALLAYITQANRRVREAMDKLLKAEREKQERDVMLLRIQINPHFLYNALNAVQWMARSNDTESIQPYMKSLMYILHYNLDNPDNYMVPLSKEIEVIEAYVMLQRFRYGNEIRFTTRLEGPVDVEIPRFVLQPLVENSIYHGLYNCSGEIELIARREQDKLVLIVRDNGRGIAPEVLEHIGEERSHGMGIGIRYVRAVVRERGGVLSIKNRIRDGKVCGSEAWIELKAVESPAESDSRPSAP